MTFIFRKPSPLKRPLVTEDPRPLLQSTDAEALAFLKCYRRLCKRVARTGRCWPLWYLADMQDAEIMRALSGHAERAN